MGTVRKGRAEFPFLMVAAALVAAVCIPVRPGRAEPVELSVEFGGDMNGEQLAAMLNGSLEFGQGRLHGQFAARPQVINNAAVAAMTFTYLTDTLVMPAGVPPEQTIFGLAQGNYQATRTYTYEGFDNMLLMSHATATLEGSILIGNVVVEGEIPFVNGSPVGASNADSIVAYNAWLTPNGPGSILDIGTIHMSSGLIAHWTGEHTYNGRELSNPYEIVVQWPILSLLDEMFEADFTNVARPIHGDLNDDGFAGQTDLDIVLGAWGTRPPSDPRADPSADGFVGQADLDYVLADWGLGIPPLAIPEPATLGIFAFCGFSLLRRKPKSR